MNLRARQPSHAGPCSFQSPCRTCRLAAGRAQQKPRAPMARTRLRPKRQVAPDEPRTAGRPALSDKAWAARKEALYERDGWRCVACGARRPLDPAHVMKRSRGGSDDLDNLLTLCRACHDLADNAAASQRLWLEALGQERFRLTWPDGRVLLYEPRQEGAR
jgi:5-methylcytosine-specific restriction endonuclease McrA